MRRREKVDCWRKYGARGEAIYAIKLQRQ